MKEIKEEKKRVIKETITLYEAYDGTRFTSTEECRKYEEGALCAARAIVNQYKVGEPKNAWDLMGGYEDHNVVGFRLPSQEALKQFLQFLFIECPWYNNEVNDKKKKELIDIITKAYRTSDIILMGINDNDDYYFINTRMNIMNNLEDFDKEEPEDA